jgi:hypothetical protein
MFWFLTMVQIPDKIRAIIERNQNEKEEMFKMWEIKTTQTIQQKKDKQRWNRLSAILLFRM